MGADLQFLRKVSSGTAWVTGKQKVADGTTWLAPYLYVPIITTRGSAAGGSSFAATANLAKFAGTAVGDVSYVWGSVGNNATITPPAGWETLANVVTFSQSHCLFRRVIDGTEPANFTFARSGTNISWALLHRCYTGVDNTTPNETAFTNSVSGSTTTFTFTHAFAPALAKSLLLMSVGQSASARTATWSSPVVEEFESAGVPAIYIGSEQLPATTTIGTRTCVFSSSITGGQTRIIVRPSATPNPGPPAAPVVTPTAGTGQVTLAWPQTPTRGAPLTGYSVQRATTTGGAYAEIATPAASATSYIATGLTAGTPYFFVVQAKTAAGNTTSAEATATPA